MRVTDEHDAPLALQLAARVEKLTPPHAEHVCQAAVLATIALLDDPRSRDGEWAAEVAAWNGARIRKIVRRGRASAWRRAQDVPGVTVRLLPNGSFTVTSAENEAPDETNLDAIAEVRAFVPGPMDQAPPGLAKLQIQSTPLTEPDRVGELTSAAPLPTDAAWVQGQRSTMVVAVTPAHEMSWGKRAAQCAHAGQRLWEAMTPTHRAHWDAEGRPVTIVHASDSLWPQLTDPAERFASVVDIHDGGFTEIPAGTLTAIAWWANSATPN